MRETAAILSEGYFGTNTAKTTNGLLRKSERFEIIGVIDGKMAGHDAGMVLEGVKSGVPVVTGLQHLKQRPEWLIIGVATVGGKLPGSFRPVVKAALESGINVISGLHQYLGEDAEFKKLAKKHGATIVDIRRPPPLSELHSFSNAFEEIDVLRIPVLGTDSSIGKRTTTIELNAALNRNGIPANMVATGQTGLLQGIKYGLPLDSIMGDYMVGELEYQILRAWEDGHPKVILIEGQGSISHPAYVCGSRAILSASRPQAVILQHAPGRKFRHYHMDEMHLPMPDLETEMKLIKGFSGADVIAITVNDQEMHPSNVNVTIREYESKFGVPAMNPLKDGCGKIVSKIEDMLQER